MMDFKELEKIMQELLGMEKFKLPNLDLEDIKKGKHTMIPVYVVVETVKQSDGEEYISQEIKEEILNIFHPENLDSFVRLKDKETEFVYQGNVYTTSYSVGKLTKLRKGIE